MKLNTKHPLGYRILLVLAGLVEPISRDSLADLMGNPEDFDLTLDAMVARGVVDEPEVGYYLLPQEEQAA